MYLKNLLPLAVLTACLFFTACNDDDDDSASNEVLLTISAGWSITAYETNLAELADDIAASIPEDELQGLSRDFYASLFEDIAAEINVVEACEADDIFIFLEDGTLSYTDSGTDCGEDGEADAPYESNSSWNLDGDQLTMTSADGESTVFTIETLTDSRLIIESSEDFEEEEFDVSLDQDLITRIEFAAN